MANQRRSAEPREPATMDMDLTGLQVLVVDDDPDALTMMREILEAAGATVISADSGRAALSALDEHTPDAIVSDLGMPGMDGFELLAELRQSPKESRRNIPAAALTAYARSEDRIRCSRAAFRYTFPSRSIRGSSWQLSRRSRAASIPRRAEVSAQQLFTWNCQRL